MSTIGFVGAFIYENVKEGQTYNKGALALASLALVFFWPAMVAAEYVRGKLN